MTEYKLYCIVSKEALKAMNGNRGKFGTQCGHAYLHAFMNSFNHHNENVREIANSYLNNQRAYKITLAVETTQELKELYDAYNYATGVALIEDAGLTVFNEPTITCLGIGPLDPNTACEKLKSLRPLL